MMSLTLEKLSKIRGNLGRDDKDITRYMASGITAPGSEITSHRDQDQWYCNWIKDPVLRHDNKDPTILKCALIEGTCQSFIIQLCFCCNILI